MDRKEKDIELLNIWKRTRSPQDLEALLRQVNPIIQKEVNRWSGVIARPVVELEARSLAMQAFDGYNPNAGAALGTHLTNYLQKLSRLIYTHQNIARIPEYQTLKINALRKGVAELDSNLGRTPTNQELAEHMGWSRAAVNELQKLVKTEQLEFHESMPSIGTESQDGIVDLIYHDLNPFQRSMFEHITGYGGKEELDNKSLMEKFKLTQGQLSYERRKLKELVSKHS